MANNKLFKSKVVILVSEFLSKYIVRNEKGDFLPGVMAAVVITSLVMAGIMYSYSLMSVSFIRSEIYHQMQIQTELALKQIAEGIIKKRSSQENDTEGDYFRYGIIAAEEMKIDYKFTSGGFYNFIEYTGSIPPTAKAASAIGDKSNLSWSVQIYSDDNAIWHLQKDYNIEIVTEKIFPVENTGQFLFTSNEDLYEHQYFLLKKLEFENYMSSVSTDVAENVVKVRIVVEENLPYNIKDNMPRDYRPRIYTAEKLVYLANSTRIKERTGIARD